VSVALAFTEQEAREQFRDFKVLYGRSYGSREAQVFQTFKKNLIIAEGYQKRETGTATYGITKFMDLSPEEFRNAYLMPKNQTMKLPEAPVAAPFNVSLPDSFDWGQKGVVTPVYDQEQCGSCWAFSATETMESYWALAGHDLTQLSMQQVVDCDNSCDGCGGGWTYKAFQYVIDQGGIDSYSSYPYTAVDGYCAFDYSNVAARFSAWGYVTQSEDEYLMAYFLYTSGPLSVCVDASSWQYYQGGVVFNCARSIDHCVQITGFQNMDTQPVWNVRNSWGTDWGVNGYIYLLRGLDICGVAEVVTHVLVA